MRGQFIAGLDPTRADYDAVGDRGGSESGTLTIAQMPVHGRGLSNAAGNNTGGSDTGETYAKSGGSTGSIDTNRRPSDTGGGQAQEHRPPFCVLAIRQWVGY